MKFARNPNAYAIPVRVYYEDTDAGGVVYYANYLKFLERCRSEWLRSIGQQQAQLLHDPGIAFVVRSVSIEYLRPARLDDELLVELEVARIGHAQIHFRQHVRRASPSIAGAWEELACATVRVACVDAALMKPTPIPAYLRTRLETLQ